MLEPNVKEDALMRTIIALLALIALLATGALLPERPTLAQGGTYYVATNGSDTSGDGSAGSPWATIGYALGEVPDGSLILVRPGTYNGRIRLDASFAEGVTVRSATPYQARLRHNATVVTSYYGQGITLEGFDIAHSGPGAEALVIQIQDLRGEPGDADVVERITLRNNILHDSYNNDILKINNGARQINVLGNIFYNQAGSDEHIDINSVSDVLVQDNIFFNDFAGSGRESDGNTSSFIVIKDSNDNDDGRLGSTRITVRRNIFLSWEGSSGSNFVLMGEDGKPYYEADTVLIENNLFLGNGTQTMRAALGVKGSQAVTFRHNTIVGDLPSLAYAMRLNTEGENLPNDNIRLYNNIWADPTGTMEDFSDTPPGETTSFTLERNLYWNGGQAIPSDPAELVNPTDDPSGPRGNPQLANPAGATPPRWDEGAGRFAGGATTIRAAFEQLVGLYATLGNGSAAIDQALAAQAASDDILGRARGTNPDIGAFERLSGPPPQLTPRIWIPVLSK